MWPKRNDGIPGPDWVPFHPPANLSAEPNQLDGEGYYTLHMDYPDVAGAIAIPTPPPASPPPTRSVPRNTPSSSTSTTTPSAMAAANRPSSSLS